MFKRLISLLLVLTLACAQLPALGESAALSELTSQEIAAAKALIATEEGAAAWQKGDALTGNMNALQILQYLQWLRHQNLDGLMLAIQDADQLLGSNQSHLDGLETLVQQLRNQVSYYEDVLDDGRSAVMNDLYMLENDTALTARERQRIALSVREQVSRMKAAIAAVVGAYQAYEKDFSGQQLTFQHLLSSVDSPEGSATGPALDALNQEAQRLTQEEQAQNLDFSVAVLSTKQFGLIVRDEYGNPLKDASVKVTSYDHPDLTKTVKTGADGLASFLIKDFRPDGNNRVTVSIVILRNGYCAQEMPRMRIRGGQGLTLRLAPYMGQPYLRMVSFNGVDILTQQNTIYYTPKNDATHYFSVLVDQQGQKVSGTITLQYQSLDKNGTLIDNVIQRSFTSGTAVDFSGPWCQRIAPNTVVSIRLQSGSTDLTVPTQLSIEKAVVEEPLIDANQMLSLVPGDLSFQFPNSIPFFGGSKMSLGLPFMKISMLVDPSGFLQLAYGKSFVSDTLNWKQENQWDKLLRLDDADKQAQRDANAVENQVYQNAGATAKPKFLGEAKAAITLFAALQGRIRESDQRMALKGQAGVQAAFQGEYTLPFNIGPLPCFVGMDFKFALGVALALGLEANWPGMGNIKLDYGSGLTLSILVELGASAGVGIKSLASLAVRMAANVMPTIRLGKTVSASVTASFYIQVVAQLLLLKWSKDLYRITFSDSTNSNSTTSAANAAASVFDHLAPGVNEPAVMTISPADEANAGVAPESETQIFARMDSLAQPVQYITLQSATERANFAFWITPTSGTGARKAELVWYNVDNPAKHGVIGSMDDTFRQNASDYAFAVEAHNHLAGVVVLCGTFEQGKYFPTESRMTGCVLRLSNGSLVMEHSQPEAPLQNATINNSVLKGQAGYLANPMVYFIDQTQPASAAAIWYFNFSCSVNTYPTNEDDTGTPLAVYSKEINKTSSYFNFGDATVDVLSARSGAQRFAPTVPYGAGAQGNNSLSCYYYTTGGGELYVRVNGSERHLDGPDDANGRITFIAPLLDHFSNENRTFLFYLQEGQADDGSDCYRLKGVERQLGQSNASFTIRDYDICLSAESFQIVTVNDGTSYGITYLYWTENLLPSSDDATQESHYRVRAVRFDRSSNSLSAPFTLVELDKFPSSLQLMLGLDNSGACQGFYTTDMVNPVSSQSAALSQRMIGFTFTLKTAVSLRGVAAYDPCVNAGDYAKLLLSVENTGNLPVSRFAVKITKGGDLLENLLINCVDPQDSLNGFMGIDAEDAAYSVSSVGSVFDGMNGDDFLIVSVGNNGNAVYERLQTELLMPGAVRTYQAAIKIPDDWSGTMTLSADVDTIYTLTHYASAMISNRNNRDALPGNWQADEVAVPVLPTNDAITSGTSNARITRAQVSAQEISREIGLGKGDLMLECQPYVDGSGATYVRVSIIGRSQTSSRIQPTLTVTRDGQTVLSHTFARAIDADFGYTLDLPAALLLGGASAGELTFTVTDNDEGNEFASFDNERTVSIGSPLRFIQQPESVTRISGEGAAFSVSVTGGQPPYAYQWQRRNPGGTWTNVRGANKATYSISAISEADAGAQLRCVVRDQNGAEIVSDVAVISVASRPPETGDASQPVLWALLCLAGVCLLMGKRKRCKR